ncbi:Uncharacterized protein PECH_000485 [Penicillium ucsense]|uniref:Uncharacterized protein n=1 Tax=Penicillium ucsense TaxID=2839758 RepID=A0A8J8W5V6_9EURO|nr:Uncharacterized protein PECM_004123 [Penicillium ucsense]KAF7733520.1 Uncharacterized protein PECH_000485 [Penicillium ucsense]
MLGRIFTPFKLPSALVVRPSRASILTRRTFAQSAVSFSSGGSQKEPLAKEWKGSQPEEHSTQRLKRGDNKDIAAAAAKEGLDERANYEGIAEGSKSQATTERGGRKAEAKAKKEHPAAPEPVIGMNDERGQKGH